MEIAKDIFDYIKQEEARYQLPVNILDWEWSMKEHIKTSFYYKHGRLLTGNSDDKPVKNITKPILNLQYRTEDIDVKDIFLYVDDEEKFHLSFLVKKYHDEVFLKEHNLDEYLDSLKISRIDYGGGLSKNINQPKPEVVPLETIVFCDQTDMLSGPIGIKHYYSPDQLKEMEEKGWGSKESGATATIDEVIILSENAKKDDKGVQNKTPGKYIEVYEVHGVLPDTFIDGEADKFSRQMHIVCFYKDDKDMASGITLFKGKEKETPFKLILRDPVYGRALGFGGAEEIFESQVWVNYDVIRMKELLDAAAKTILKTTDASFASRNKISDMENLEVAVLAEGTDLNQVDTFPRNLAAFEKSVSEWETHAQQMGAANDSIMGVNPNSGTPFKLQELVTQESHGLHDYRKGQFAKHIEEVYRDWIIPYMVKEITKGRKFLASLDLEDMQKIAEILVENEGNNMIKEKILNGEEIDPQEVEARKQQVRDDFMKDNNKFIEILEDELKGAKLSISINIAGKQKDMAGRVDKLVNIFRQVASNPAVLEQPQMAKLFNQILESSGLSPIDFGSFKIEQPAPQMPQMPQNNMQPIQNLATNQQL